MCIVFHRNSDADETVVVPQIQICTKIVDSHERSFEWRVDMQPTGIDISLSKKEKKNPVNILQPASAFIASARIHTHPTLSNSVETKTKK